MVVQVITDKPEINLTWRHWAVLQAIGEVQRQLVLEALAGPLYFVPNPLFRRVNAVGRLFDNGMDIGSAKVGWYHPMVEDLATLSAPTSSLLTTAQEQHLFLRYNYARMRVKKAARKFIREPGRKNAREIAFWQRRAKETKDIIAGANLALVLAMAKRTRMTDVDFAELISEGNMALLRAVEKFDPARGFKFSTYACRAILKGFSRVAVKSNRYHAMFPTEFEPGMERSNEMDVRRQSIAKDAVDDLHDIMTHNSAALTEVERRVIEARFAVNRPEDAGAMTLAEVGEVIGVTKERVRQIQNGALEKLRAALDGRILTR
ncbi:MAG: sigma-70 family RNA polymerase sigma factor [Phycisphaerae bacterium]